MIRIILILIGIITITVATNTTFLPLHNHVKHDVKTISHPTKIRIGGWVPDIDLNSHSAKLSPSEYLLLDYKKHASSFNEFCEKFPTVTLDTFGIVDSKTTFGNVGRNKFGKLRFSTRNFQLDHDVHFVDIINVVDQKRNTYYVSVNIAIGFKTRGSTLILVPSNSLTLTSRGIHGRELIIDWGVKAVRFNRANL